MVTTEYWNYSRDAFIYKNKLIYLTDKRTVASYDLRKLKKGNLDCRKILFDPQDFVCNEGAVEQAYYSIPSVETIFVLDCWLYLLQSNGKLYRMKIDGGRLKELKGASKCSQEGEIFSAINSYCGEILVGSIQDDPEALGTGYEHAVVALACPKTGRRYSSLELKYRLFSGMWILTDRH